MTRLGGLKARLLTGLRKNPQALRLRSWLKNRRLHVPYAGNGYVHEIEEVHRCLRDCRLESAVVPLSLSIETLRVIDILRERAAAALPQG